MDHCQYFPFSLEQRLVIKGSQVHLFTYVLLETKVSNDTIQTLCGGQCSVEFKMPFFLKMSPLEMGVLHMATWNIGVDEGVR